MPCLIKIVGGFVIICSLGYVALESFDDTGWFLDHYSQASFVAAFRHLFSINLKYSSAKYWLVFGASLLMTGILLG